MSDPCRRSCCTLSDGKINNNTDVCSVIIIRFILIGELFSKFSTLFFAQFFNLPYFPGLFCYKRNIGMLTNLIFLVLENFTNSDRTPPPYIDTYLRLFPNFGDFGKNALR